MRRGEKDFKEEIDKDKLPAYGIKKNEAIWIASFLFGRAQVVNFEGTLSQRNFITQGVPQGSTLGPLPVSSMN